MADILEKYLNESLCYLELEQFAEGLYLCGENKYGRNNKYFHNQKMLHKRLHNVDTFLHREIRQRKMTAGSLLLLCLIFFLTHEKEASKIRFYEKI